MNEVRIFRPARTAMQSGRAKTREWVLEYAPGGRETPDALMGWAGAGDTHNQVRLFFDTKEEAVAFAEREGLTYQLIEDPAHRPPRPKSYADNFRFDKVG